MMNRLQHLTTLLLPFISISSRIILLHHYFLTISSNRCLSIRSSRSFSSLSFCSCSNLNRNSSVDKIYDIRIGITVQLI